LRFSAIFSVLLRLFVNDKPASQTPSAAGHELKPHMQ
jgi:hypothetical protein